MGTEEKIWQGHQKLPRCVESLSRVMELQGTGGEHQAMQAQAKIGLGA